jgi:thiol-disulfide isomerase/thioredoxin
MRAKIPRFQGSVEQFKDELSSSPGLSVVIFHGPWCGTCRRLLQLLPNVADAFPGLHFLAVDVDQSKEIAEAMGVNVVPTTKIVEIEASEIATRGSILGAKLPEIKKALQDLTAQ